MWCRAGPSLALGVLMLTSCSTPATAPADVQDFGAEQVPLVDIPDTRADRGLDTQSEEQGVEILPDQVDTVPEIADTVETTLPDLNDTWTEETDGADAEDVVEVLEEIYVPPCEEGIPCDDLNPCTFDDSCVETVCTGTPYACDDLRPCTLDTCDGLGNCKYTLIVGKCLINGVCAKSGDTKESNQCLFCTPGKNAHAWSEEQFAPCSDGDACTADDHCFDGECVGDTTVCDDGNPCTWDICDHDLGCEHWPANEPCDDLDPCTANDFCKDGECLGGPAPGCDDLNPCTAEFCQEGKGCIYAQLDDAECDDGNACTVGDACWLGVCVPGADTVVCQDFNSCTDDVCDPDVGCIYPLNDYECCIKGTDINFCADGDPCTVDGCNVDTGACVYLPNEGACTDQNACTENDSCSEGLCQGQPVDCDDDNPCTDDFCLETIGCIHNPVNAACDDASVCTLNDWCDEGKCVGTKLNCNDYNPCTDDVCDPESGCLNQFNDAQCEDFDLCTGGDQCVEGQCEGVPKECNDGNECTNDYCDPAVGCQNLFNSQPCDDGDECTAGEQCDGGACVAGEVICVSCDYEFSDAVNRLTEMAISTDASEGNALDLNGDGSPDNSMAGIGGLANSALADSLNKGDVHLLLEHHDIQVNGSIYSLAAFVGELAPGFEQCDFVAGYCGFEAKEGTFNSDTCAPSVLFDNASIFQGQLVAGGADYEFPWQIPLSAETVLSISLYNATIHADVTVQQGLVTSISGIIGGAIPKESFLAAIDALPDEGLPLPKDMIVQLIQGLVVNDIDTDGNGSPDAASIAIKFEGIAAGLTGIE